MLVHVVTKKGKGYAPAEAAADKYHGVQKFDVITGEQDKGPGGGPPAYQNVFGEALATLAERDPRIVRDHRGDAVGHRRRQVRQAHFPDRAFDVGIAEQHAVTFAAGLAAQGMRPVLRDLFDLPSARLRPGRPRRRHPESAGPLRHRPGRAGRRRRRDPCRQLRRHLSRTLPNFVVMAAADEAELVHMVHTMALHDSGPDRGPLSARQRHRRGAARDARAARDRQGPDRPRGQEGRDPLARHPARGGAEGGRHPRRQGPLPPPSPTCASPSRSTRS